MLAARALREPVGLLAVSAIMVLACWGLTACGGDVVTTPRASKLCTQTRQVDRLTVTRTNAFPKNRVRFGFPAEVSVSDPEQARSVALAVCALPAMPNGPMSCGSGSFTGSYKLTFTASTKRLPEVRITSNCQEVYGLGQLRWVARTPAFWRVLGKAMGLSHPDVTTFLAPASG
jgi:hypothetical protein